MQAGVEILAWLVLAFADGPDCLLQASVHWRPDGPAVMREDGCAVHSRHEGSHVLFWSDSRWVVIKIPRDARSLSYRWGRAMAFVNGKSVRIQHGNIGNSLQAGPRSRQDATDPVDRWRISDGSMRDITALNLVPLPPALLRPALALRIESGPDDPAL
jgi:hypothetical protein